MASSSNWRDWVQHPELVTAMWPHMLASGIAPASCLALLGMCRYTRDAVLLETPRTTLTVQLGADNPPAAGPAVLLLQHSGRTQPTTLSLVNTTVGKPSMVSARYPPDPAQGSDRATTVLRLPALLTHTSITRLDLTGVVIDDSLLLTTRALPSLTHLELCDAHFPDQTCTFEPTRLPERVRTLVIGLSHTTRWIRWGLPLQAFARLVHGFLSLDTITDLTMTAYRCSYSQNPGDDHIYAIAATVFETLEAVASDEWQALSLLRLSLPQFELNSDLAEVLGRVAPQLEYLQVFSVKREPLGDQVPGHHPTASWRTLQVQRLDLAACRNLPLGGTEPLDISCTLCSTHAALMQEGIEYLLSLQTRPVRLAGSGADGGTFVFDSRRPQPGSIHPVDLVMALSVLSELSKAPVRRLDIVIDTVLDVEKLLQALQALPTVTRLHISPTQWDTSGGTQDDLLADLPLHVERVCLDSRHHNLDHYEVFKRMAANASNVPGRQDRPLRFSANGVGKASQLWKSVERCWARGAKGVVMEEVRVVPTDPGLPTRYRED